MLEAGFNEEPDITFAFHSFENIIGDELILCIEQKCSANESIDMSKNVKVLILMVFLCNNIFPRFCKPLFSI